MPRNRTASSIRTMLVFVIALALATGFMPAAALGFTSYAGADSNIAVSKVGEIQGESADTAQATDAAANIAVSAERMGIGGGGACFDPAISPFDPNEMAVGTDMGDVYITHDAGVSWSKKTMGRAYDIQYDPTRLGVVYACGSGIWRSVDNGETFTLMWPRADHINGEPTKFEDFRSYFFNEDGYDPYSQVISIAVDRESDDTVYALAYLDDYSSGSKKERLVLYKGSYKTGEFEEIARRDKDMRGLFWLYDNSKVVVHDGVPWIATQAGVFAYDRSSESDYLSAVYRPEDDQPDGANRFSIVDFDQTFDEAGNPVYWIAEGLESGERYPVTSLRKARLAPQTQGDETAAHLEFKDLTGKMNDSAYGLDCTQNGQEYPLRISELAAASPTRAYFYVRMKAQKEDSILARYDESATADKPFR